MSLEPPTQRRNNILPTLHCPLLCRSCSKTHKLGTAKLPLNNALTHFYSPARQPRTLFRVKAHADCATTTAAAASPWMASSQGTKDGFAMLALLGASCGAVINFAANGLNVVQNASACCPCFHINHAAQ